ncbi:AbrB/MazE/SpoVT family DNA-binding domain-containing protein [Methanobrevibacter sp. OttesenSCG-928-K11]|nr:AbrB/MazE/SpoVT family DNA-binding domain-containing protein [Methanobrevibacter sp. OttesenSCG-928-K11]MDL2271208.1 AbrB/MazE/SpoVT family DNA-binding domain-containing protein [Methanobrevibacter sp. OttesenSCG-928-I08]
MVRTSLYSGFQTVIPAEIRKKLNITLEDSLDWDLDENNQIKIKIIKQKNLKDLTKFSINSPKKTNSVDLKRKSARGDF